MTRTQFRRRLLSCSIGACSALFLHGGLAQTSNENSAVALTEEIIVTARRVEERAQDVPISMTVYNQDQLDNNNITNAIDIAQLTPSLTANQKYGPDNTTFSIRGFFQELRTTASVGVYFSEVIAQRAPGSISAGGDGAGPGAFFDLQNVQVLKGPQGTLFGRNTTGGAVLLVPQKPTDQFGGYVEGGAGNYDMGRVQGVINIPFSDSVRFRAGLDSQQRDGYLNNISGIGPGDFGNVDYVAGRASLVVDLAPGLENYTIATYTDSDNNGYVAHLDEAIPARLPLGVMAEAQLARETGNSIYDVANTQEDANQQLESWQLINTTTWEVSDSLTIKNILAYGEITNTVKFDPYGTNFLLPDTFLGSPTGADAEALTPFATLRSIPGGGLSDQSNFVEEFQLQGESFGSRLNWQAGIYYESSKAIDPSGTAGPSSLACQGEPTDFNCEDVIGKYMPIGTLFGTVLPPVEGAQGLMQWQIQESDFQNVAAYAQGTFDLTDNLSVTAGVRYTRDEVDTVTDKYVVRFPDANDPRVYCKTPGLGYDDPSGRSILGVSPDFDNSPYLPTSALLSGACQETVDTDSEAPTWTIGLEYKLLDDTLLFAKYSRGYRQGSTNPFSLPGYYTFEDEKVDVYEAGVKTQWYGSVPGTLNISGYYNDFTDQQIQAGALVFGLAPNAIIINAGQSEMYGVEIEAGLTPTDNFRLSASYGYLHTELKKADLPENTATTIHFPTSTPGTALPLSPEHQLTLAATYSLPIDETMGFMDAGITYSYTDDQFFTFSNYPKGKFPAYELINMHFNWKSVAGGPIDLALFATNLFDEEYIVNVNEQTSSGFISRTYGPPRMYGARIRYNFGQ